MSTPSDPDSTRTERRTRTYRRSLAGLTLSLLGAWLCMMAPLPWTLGMGVFALAAIVFLIRMVIAAWALQRRFAAIGSLVVGVPACLLLLAATTVTAVFYGPMAELEQCQRTAITERAKSSCQAQAEENMSDWLRDFAGG
ncbi:MAG: hypothetical protein Q4G40_00530 [Brachybacterium sp.]|nr:hypothetical protein [Brachybacterium sp.]